MDDNWMNDESLYTARVPLPLGRAVIVWTRVSSNCLFHTVKGGPLGHSTHSISRLIVYLHTRIALHDPYNQSKQIDCLYKSRTNRNKRVVTLEKSTTSDVFCYLPANLEL